MKYKLINPINKNYSALEQIFTNRGIKYEDIPHYINTTDDDINSFFLLGEDKLKEAAFLLLSTIGGDGYVVIIVDCDVDGYTSSAILINYLNDIFPTWASSRIDVIHHGGKTHGLADCYKDIIEKNKYSLVICPDSSSFDGEYHKELKEHGINTICLDHHPPDESSKISEYAIVINNQCCEYPNKQLSGAGIVWQFCRYIDYLLVEDNSDKYLDLVALGLTADMQSLLSFETKHLINKGFSTENIHNPFIYHMWQKNKFKLGEKITSWGAAFYIAPLLNAITRSGTLEEKEIVFKSMLKYEAFKKVPCTKRGAFKGEEETIVEQAMRICTNVKNRQTKRQDDGLTFLEKMIEEKNLLDNKVLLFLLEPEQIDRNIAGLIANKVMAKYQRPCCVLTKIEDDGNISYMGSARGCNKTGINNFKQICLDSGCVEFVAGHNAAFGTSLPKDKINLFIDKTNEMLKDVSDEPIYYVDYIFEGENVNPQNILDIADMDRYWGQDFGESLVAIKDLKVTNDMITLMSADKNPTLKITLPNRVSIIKFHSNQKEYENMIGKNISIVGKCNKNIWLENITPQILIEDYELSEINFFDRF